MSTAESENGVASLEEYTPFTPFEDSYTFEAEPSRLATSETLESGPIVTPFVSEYAGEEAVSGEEQELRDLLFSVYDQELDESLAQLAEEAWNATNDRAEMFGETMGSPSAEQFLQEWISPLQAEAERMIDNVAQALTAADPETMGEAELDEVFERFTPRDTGLESYFEEFLGGLGKKLKTFARKAIEVAKKGLTLFPGVGFLLNKLKALVKPLLDRVLRLALDRLPPALRPVARQLAQRLLGKVQMEEEDLVAPAVADVSSIQHEFDLQMASLLFAPESEHEAIIGEVQAEADREEASPVAELHDARARFVDELERGIAPQEALENFIPAVMAVLPIARTAMGIIGRQRVVNFLAGFLAKFISKYVPADASNQLSQAIVDTGLRMLSLETPPSGTEVQQLAPDAIASAVEDTVRRVAELDETTLEHPALLEAAATEAFHQSAAESFPPQLLIPELHEATVRGTWVSMPLGRRRKYYKKYTHVFDVQITPQIAASLKTTGGATIAAFLQDQLRVTPPVQARVHLYQAMLGTSFARVARLEAGVAGLGRGARQAARLFHPLTVAAAGTLLQEPRLGRDVPGRFMSTRHRIAVGQRFYYLEIAGARQVPTIDGRRGTVATRRSSEVNVTLDFPKDEFRIFTYLSEADAQDVASKLRRRDVTAVLVAAKRIYAAGVETALRGDIHRHVKILTEALPQEQFFGQALRRLTGQVKSHLIGKVVEWIGKGVANYVQAGAAELISATEDPADGVTLVVTIANPPGAPLVRKLLRGDVGVGDVANLASLFKGDPRVTVRTVAGFRFD
jgi:hypothetical protein